MRRKKKDWRENKADREGKKEIEGMENSDEKRGTHMVSSSLVVLCWNNHGVHLITSVSLKNMGFHKCAAKCFNHSRFEFCNAGL